MELLIESRNIVGSDEEEKEKGKREYKGISDELKELCPSPKTKPQSTSSKEGAKCKSKGSLDWRPHEDLCEGELEHDWKRFEGDCNELPMQTIVKIGNMKKREDYCSS
jgi:hypothetical protein